MNIEYKTGDPDCVWKCRICEDNEKYIAKLEAVVEAARELDNWYSALTGYGVPEVVTKLHEALEVLEE